MVRVHEPVSILDMLEWDSRAHAWSIPQALEAIQHAEAGVIVLLRRQEDEAELVERIREPDEAVPHRHALRDYGIGAQILRDLGVTKMRVLSLPRKMPSMTGFGLEVIDFISN